MDHLGALLGRHVGLLEAFQERCQDEVDETLIFGGCLKRNHHFWPPRSLKTIPRIPQDCPRGPQDGPRWPQDGLQEGSRRSTMTSKTVPKRPRGFEPSKSGPGRPKRTFKWPPRSLKTIPRIPQDCPNIAPERVSISMMLGPSRLQNDLRGSPDASRCIQKEPPRGPGGTHMQMKHALIKGKLSGMR